MDDEDPFEKYDKAIVKVFIINHDGNWSDCGAGRITFKVTMDMEVFITVSRETQSYDQDHDEIEKSREERLRGDEEKNPSVILKCCLNHGKNFTRNQSNFKYNLATIINWEQIDIEENIALSFLDPWACYQIWIHLGNYIKHISYEESIKEINEENLDEILFVFHPQYPDEVKEAYVNQFITNVK